MIDSFWKNFPAEKRQKKMNNCIQALLVVADWQFGNSWWWQDEKSIFRVSWLQQAALCFYLIIADAVPAACLIWQSLQILDPKLQNEPDALEVCSWSFFSNNRLSWCDCALYLHINPILKTALRFRLHQPVTVLQGTRWVRAFLFSCLNRSRNFPLLANRRDCFTVVITGCVCQIIIKKMSRLNTRRKKKFYFELSFTCLHFLCFCSLGSFSLEASLTVCKGTCFKYNASSILVSVILMFNEGGVNAILRIYKMVNYTFCGKATKSKVVYV